MEHTFKVIEENEDKFKSIIEMGGLTTKFTALDVLEHLSYVRKTLREAEAQLEAEAIQDKMALEIIPILADLPQDKFQLVMSYSARQLERKDKENLIEACNKTIETYQDRLESIKQVLGLKEIHELDIVPAPKEPIKSPFVENNG